MAIVRRTLAELKANPPRLTAEEKARYDVMTDDEIEQNALDDPDNSPSTDEELDRGVFGRAVRQARQKLGLSQREFAERFHINLSRLRDWEQGRFQPDSVAWAYVKLIEREPETVERVLSAA